jgi:hypothetical protein
MLVSSCSAVPGRLDAFMSDLVIFNFETFGWLRAGTRVQISLSKPSCLVRGQVSGNLERLNSWWAINSIEMQQYTSTSSQSLVSVSTCLQRYETRKYERAYLLLTSVVQAMFVFVVCKWTVMMWLAASIASVASVFVAKFIVCCYIMIFRGGVLRCLVRFTYFCRDQACDFRIIGNVVPIIQIVILSILVPICG